MNAAVHEATFEGNAVRWETRVVRCDGGAESPPVTIVLPLERNGANVRLARPGERDGFRERVDAVGARDHVQRDLDVPDRSSDRPDDLQSALHALRGGTKGL